LFHFLFFPSDNPCALNLLLAVGARSFRKDAVIKACGNNFFFIADVKPAFHSKAIGMAKACRAKVAKLTMTKAEKIVGNCS